MVRTFFLRCSCPWACTLLLALLASSVNAQLGEEVPSRAYYVAVQAFYSGEYREAEQAFRQETRRGIRTVQARWIDSICYHSMLGEVYFNQGRNPQALAEFDQACQLMLTYPNWLLRVKFNQPPRPDGTRSRRVPPWGQSSRHFVLGQFSNTEQVLVGQLDNSRALQTGGVVQSPQYWRVNISEVMRTSALAIRRRNELLGPLAPYDRISKELSDMLARGGQSPPNHWSSALIDLQRGLALIGMGRYDEANTVLGRAVIVDGQYDHPLTCVALMEQGRLAMFRGDSRLAAQLFLEASYSAFYYDNWDVVTESIWLGWYNHMALGSGGLYQPLDVVAAWSQANRLNHAATKLRLAEAESLVTLGQLPQATTILEDTTRRMGDMRAALPGIHQIYVQAAVRYAQGKLTAGNELLNQALASQIVASLRNFQIARCNALYDSRDLSARVAGQLYTTLLSDPTTAEWFYQPLDSMAIMKTPQDGAFDRWLMSALERKEVPQAIEIAEQTKRRRYLASLPWGGRLAALRSILESQENELSRDAILQRQQLLTNFPAYRDLLTTGTRIYEDLRAGPVIAPDGSNSKSLNDRYDALQKNCADREHILAQLALRHVPSTSDFPPLKKTSDLQAALGEGEAIVIFHAAAGDLYGFLLSATDAYGWQLGQVTRLKTGLGELLRAVGNYGANRNVTMEDLKNDKWREMAAAAYQALFADARLDLSKTKSLAIVPDGLLWYLPFEALIPPDEGGDRVLMDRVPIRYGPLASLTISDSRPLRRPMHTGISVTQLAASDAASGDTMVQELEKAVPNPVQLPTPLPVPGYLIAPLLDELVSLDDMDSASGSALAWSPLPRSRSAANDTLEAWYGLPFGGPERIILTGVATAAEQGLKTSRRGNAPSGELGSEIFQSTCGLMANGARTILLTRWRTSGRTNFELVREFVQELPNESATEAWQRSCLLAREAPLDAAREPRLKRKDDSEELPTADHPFFWAGYLLVDTSPAHSNDKRPEKPLAKADETKVMPLPPPSVGSNPLIPPSPTLPSDNNKGLSDEAAPSGEDAKPKDGPHPQSETNGKEE